MLLQIVLGAVARWVVCVEWRLRHSLGAMDEELTGSNMAVRLLCDSSRRRSQSTLGSSRGVNVVVECGAPGQLRE